MKRLVCIIIAIILLIAAGCTSNTGGNPNSGNQPPNYSSSEIMDKIKEAVNVEDMMDVEDDMFDDFFGIGELVDNWALIMPGMGFSVFETAVFVAKDADKINDIKADLERRAGEVYEFMKDYNPAGAEVAKDYKVETNGKYILFVMAENAEDIVSAFKAIF